MMRSHVLIMVSVAMLGGWTAHAQGPSMFGPAGPGSENPNPRGVPLPIAPDAKFRPGGIPAPPVLGPDGMPRKPMPAPYGPMPGPYYPPPMPPGGPYAPSMGPMPNAAPFYPIPGAMPNGRAPFYPPMPAPAPPGQPYLVPLDRGEGPPPLPPSPPSGTPQPAPTPPVTREVDRASFVPPPSPFMAQEPYVLYEGGRTQKGVFSPVVQCGYHVWAGAEFLYWRSKNSPAPPVLATTAPAGAAATVDGLPIGAIGRADTTVVLGGQSIELVNQSGGRFTVGAWGDPDQTLGIEANYFILPARGDFTGTSSAGTVSDVSLAVPFNNTNPAAPGETAILLALNNSTINGNAGLFLSSQLQGGELNLLGSMVDYYGFRLHTLVGFRYLGLYENLEFSTSQRGLLAGQFTNTLDQFQTRNNFFGGQLGVKLDYQYKWFFINGAAEIAYGNMVQTVNIAGRTFTNAGPALGATVDPTVATGGIFAQTTNIGRFSRNRDAVVPELTINAGVQVFNWLRVFGGYNFIYASRVVRPGDQIDRSINATQLTALTGVPSGPLVGPSQPAFIFRESDFWAQGLNFGLEVRY